MKRRSFIQLGALSPFASLAEFDAGWESTAANSFVSEPERKVGVSGEYDVVICGAGPAGVCAAIESGRNGARTLLIEVHGCLGGVWTSGLLTWILDQANKPGLMREFEDRLLAAGGVSRDIDTGGVLSFDAEIMKMLLEEVCVDAGVDILYHARAVAVAKNNRNRITHVITESKTGREAWRGNIFIDCTGDGDLAALGGCGFDLGREGDGALQPFSMLALVTGISFNEVREFSRWSEDSRNGSPSKRKLLNEISRGGFQPSYLKPGLYPIRKDLFMVMANHGYGYSPLNAAEVTKATINARTELNKIIESLQTNGGVWKNIRLVATAEQIGTREGRRIHGLYKVTKEDLIKGARFEDAVCRVTFGVDVHSVSRQNEESAGKSYNQGVKSKDYDIPLRALIAKDVGALMMAGRCISGDFISHSSYRVTGNAAAMGQAAGITAAFSSKKDILPQEVDFKLPKL